MSFDFKMPFFVFYTVYTLKLEISPTPVCLERLEYLDQSFTAGASVLGGGQRGLQMDSATKGEEKHNLE